MTVLTTAFVLVSRMTTLAEGTTAPAPSVTRPVIAPVLVWANVAERLIVKVRAMREIMVALYRILPSNAMGMTARCYPNEPVRYVSILMLMLPAFAADSCKQRIVKARGVFQSLIEGIRYAFASVDGRPKILGPSHTKKIIGKPRARKPHARFEGAI